MVNPATEFVSVYGARLHNLQNINVQFPVGQISVVCGPSGCGKSTLVLDVLHAESRRRYLETLSPSALQLLGGPRHIPVDAIQGLRPSIALENDSGTPVAKATVATLCEIAPILRTLFASVAKPACPQCGFPMESHSIRSAIQELAALPSGTRLQIIAPVLVHDRTLEELASTYLSQGYTRALSNGSPLSLDSITPQQATEIPKQFSLVVDRIIVKDNQRTRLSEAIDSALRISLDQFEAEINGANRYFSLAPRCPTHRISSPPLEPNHYSPWSPQGQCPLCKGNGQDEHHSLCTPCHGLGLAPRALQSSWKNISWAAWHQTPIDALLPLLEPLWPEVPTHLKSTVQDLPLRLQSLQTLGLGYLTLGRLACTLSSGEQQRLRLAGLATGHLDGVLLCLDEPASGLHAHDVEKLWALLEQLKQRGNTVVLIEHHPLVIQRADWIVEMGPAAGEHGGQVLFQGPLPLFFQQTKSPTAQWLQRLHQSSPPPPATGPTSHSEIILHGANTHNLKNLNVSFPMGAFTVICGVSGSGKSSLLWDSLAPAVKAQLSNGQSDLSCGKLQMDGIECLAGIRAGSFGAQRRSTVATATGIMTPLRDLFAHLPESKIRGYGPSRFSTTSVGGRCETCKGEGVLRDPSGYEETECPICQGRRFRDDTLEVRFKTFSIAEILDFTIERALELWAHYPKFTQKLRPLAKTGLDYLRLGQPTTHLSGGERQRLRLSLELAKADRPHTLYLFDEPARGLHQGDIAKLIQLFKGLTRQGHTVIAIEHQPDFRFAADHLIELGPGAGEAGGMLINP